MSERYFCHTCQDFTDGGVCPFCEKDFSEPLRNLRVKIQEKTREIQHNAANNNTVSTSINGHGSK